MGLATQDGIVVPQCDARGYRGLRLPNGMDVLLISDPDTDKAAAAMNVDVGYFSDPEGLPGLAHFLEHMLFFASEKYPEEDSYSKFLAEHGGHANAYTTMEHTNYQLDVAADHLEEALDRFAQFFIGPLLSADATGREVNAVHSEHSKNLTSDAWRFMQLQKSLADPSHPYHKFGTGSKDTLLDAPLARGEDTRDALVQFYQDNYSADRMHLVVYGREPLDKLEEMVRVRDRFPCVQNKSLGPIRFTGQPHESRGNKVMVKCVPVAEGHSLELVWSVPSDLPQYYAAPSRYLSHLLGHEGHGSLFALLKQKGWASSLMAGESVASWDFALFSVEIELTDEGQEHVEDVLEHTFEYIGMLQSAGGVSEEIFTEMRDICHTKFNFQDKQQPFFYTRQLAANMQLYLREDWVVGAFLPRTFDRDAIGAVLGELSPQNARIFWSSKSFEAPSGAHEPSGEWQAEHWYGTKYSAAEIAEALLLRLTAAFQGKGPGLEGGALHLPKPNPFIPTDFTLLTPVTGEDATPSVVLDTPMSRLWHKPDQMFGLPKACLFLHLCSAAAYSSPEAALLTRLFTNLLLDYLNEIAYDAQVAGLAYSLNSTVHGLQMVVSGYSHKLLVLAQDIMERVVAFQVHEDRFHVVKAKALKDFENFKYDQPYQQGMYTHSVMTEHNKWHIQDYLRVLPGLRPADLVHFAPTLLRRVFLEYYCAGNLSPAAAEALARSVEAKLKAGPLVASAPCLAAEMPQRRFVDLPTGASFCHSAPVPNAEDQNSALAFYLHVGLDAAVAEWREPKHVVAQLLVQILQRDAFHELRTVQQLGYIVFLLSRYEGGLHSIAFIVQSDSKDAKELEQRVERFLQASAEKVKGLSPDEFKTHVDALVSLKKEKRKNMREDAGIVWREIDDGTLTFDRVQKEVAALERATLNDVVHFFDAQVACGAPLRRKLSVQMESASIKPEQGEPGAASAGAKPEGGGQGAAGTEGSQQISDIFSFRRGLSLYPSVKGAVPPPEPKQDSAQ